MLRSSSPDSGRCQGHMPVSVLTNHRILVVDDDADMRDGLAEVLANEGYVVATAANGQVALDLMRRGPLPDLVLLDLMMPVLDGLGFRAQQKSDPVLAHVPVVVITASGHLLEVSKRRDFDACIAKPVHLDHLLSTVRLCAPMLAKRAHWLTAV